MLVTLHRNRWSPGGGIAPSVSQRTQSEPGAISPLVRRNQPTGRDRWRSFYAAAPTACSRKCQKVVEPSAMAAKLLPADRDLRFLPDLLRGDHDRRGSQGDRCHAVQVSRSPANSVAREQCGS